MAYRRVLLKLSGEILAGKESHGISAERLAEVAREEVHRLGLKGKVRANKAGCLDACGHGPVCVVYPDAVWYAPRTDEDMREIVASHLRDGCPVERLIIPGYAAKKAAPEAP